MSKSKLADVGTPLEPLELELGDSSGGDGEGESDLDVELAGEDGLRKVMDVNVWPWDRMRIQFGAGRYPVNRAILGDPLTSTDSPTESPSRSRQRNGTDLGSVRSAAAVSFVPAMVCSRNRRCKETLCAWQDQVREKSQVIIDENRKIGRTDQLQISSPMFKHSGHLRLLIGCGFTNKELHRSLSTQLCVACLRCSIPSETTKGNNGTLEGHGRVPEFPFPTSTSYVPSIPSTKKVTLRSPTCFRHQRSSDVATHLKRARDHCSTSPNS
jgi:hypothetical protein